MLKEMPEGYFLQTYDDCGFPGRMPQVPPDAYRYTFPEGSVDASLRDRTISHGMPDFKMLFQGLEQDIPYVLAVTYASEREQPVPRVQSLYAGDIVIHGQYKPPEGTSQRILLPLPKEAIQNGQLELSFIRNEGPNAVVSAVELWAPIPSPKALTLEAIPSISGKIHGAVLDFCRNEDPTRPIAFNNEWNRDGKACDISILHYPPLNLESCPFVEGDPRPILMDEYFPPQTFTFEKELNLNPGLDVVNWSTGQNAQESIWNRMYNDPRVLGGAIWAGIDEEFFFSDGSVRGYGPWGFIDVWRRKKSLWWDAKRIFSPIWIATRQIPFTGQKSIKVPIENRYSFTDLSVLAIQWQIGSETGNICSSIPPGSSGELEIPIPDNTQDGSLLILRFFDRNNRLVTANGIQLGEQKPVIMPKANAGSPAIKENGKFLAINGENFAFTIDRETGAIISVSGFPELLRLPLLFVARQEARNIFNPHGLEYAQFPVDGERTIDAIQYSMRENAIEIIIKEHFKDFVGIVNIVLDKIGFAELSFDYEYSGEAFSMSEFGLQIHIDNRYQKIWWNRQTEWDVYPDDHIGRSEGEAQAHRSTEVTGSILRIIKPDHPWHLDENEFGTRGFRATKYNIYEAKISGDDGSGIHIFSNGTTDVRVHLAGNRVMLNLLVSPIKVGRDNQMGCPVRRLQPGEHLAGKFYIRLYRF